MTFLGWATPPGGPVPYWQDCYYPNFTCFQLLNGAAFLLSMTAVLAVTFFPLTLLKRPQDAAWFGCCLLLLAIATLITAFMFAGLVSVGVGSPARNCAAIYCASGGVPCDNIFLPYTFYNTTVVLLDRNLVALNQLAQADSSTVLCYGEGKTLNAPYDNVAEEMADWLSQYSCGVMSSTSPSRAQASSVINNVSLSSWSPSTWVSAIPHPVVDINVTGLLDEQTIRPYQALRYRCYQTSPEWDTSICDARDGLALSVDSAGHFLTKSNIIQNGGIMFADDTGYTGVASTDFPELGFLVAMLIFFCWMVVVLAAYVCAHRMRHTRIVIPQLQKLDFRQASMVCRKEVCMV